MAENREEILANFQGITNIEDVAEAIFHLEESNWDLHTAINCVMPQDGPSARNSSSDNNDAPDVEMVDEEILSVITPNTRPPDREENNQASTSSPRNSSSYVIMFYVVYSGQMHEFKIPSSATVSDLKKQMEKVLNVPKCKQYLRGLGDSTNSSTLSSLGLQSPVVIRLRTIDQSRANNDEMAARLAMTYTLRVKHEEKEYVLKFPGTKSVREVKIDIYTLTDIPVRYQVWTGWPAISGLDNTELAMLGLNSPEHELTVKQAPPNKPKEYKRIIIESSDSENSSVEDIEEVGEGFNAEEDMFVDLVQSPRLEPLMSENVEDEVAGCIEFVERFRERYGPETPNFFQGTLDDAIKESCHKPAIERKLLCLYLHHDKSVLSNVFCSHTLSCETVLQTLSANFVVYGWDLTHPSNNQMLINAIKNTLGPVASMMIHTMPVDKLPALIIIMRARSNTEIYSVINGNVGVAEVVGSLVEAVERFTTQRDEDAKLERERDARQRVKREQDEAYQQSLAADRAKEEIKKQQELEMKQEQERAETERLMEEAKKEEMRAGAEARVPAEPCAEERDREVTRIRVRLPPPHYDALERRFYATDTLQALLDFIASKGYPQENYKVISSWPRRDLTTESLSSTLKDLKLYPQETVMLEER